LDTIIKESPVLKRIPARDFVGNNFNFNIENAEAGVGWYKSGDTWVESAATWAEGAVALSTMGGDVDTDIFAKKTKGDYSDLITINTTGKAKAMAYEFERAFLYGLTTTTPDAKEMKGLLKWIANYETSALTTADLDALNNDQVIANSATSAVLSLEKLDALIDAVRPGKPDVLIMDRNMRRYLGTLERTTATSIVRVTKDQFGDFVDSYAGIPILINDFSKANFQDGASSVLAIASTAVATTRAATYDNSIILALRFSNMDGVCLIQNGAMEHYPIGELETKRAYRNRFAWDVATVMLGKKCAAALINATDATF
jgi:hypothetical protein